MSNLKSNVNSFLGVIKDIGNAPILIIIFGAGFLLFILNFVSIMPTADYISQRMMYMTMEKVSQFDGTYDTIRNIKDTPAVATNTFSIDSTGKRVEVQSNKPNSFNYTPTYMYVEKERGISYSAIIIVLMILNVFGMVKGSIEIEFRTNSRTSTTPSGAVEELTEDEKVILRIINTVLWVGYGGLTGLILYSFGLDIMTSTQYVNWGIEIPTMLYQILLLILGYYIDEVLGAIAAWQYEKFKNSRPLSSLGADERVVQTAFNEIESLWNKLLNNLNSLPDLAAQKAAYSSNSNNIKDDFRTLKNKINKFNGIHKQHATTNQLNRVSIINTESTALYEKVKR